LSRITCTPTGVYYYIETSPPTKPGFKARLVSESFLANSVRCFQFYYHMYGKSIGQLNIYTKTASAQSLAWSKSSNQGNEWVIGQATVSSAQSFQVGTIIGMLRNSAPRTLRVCFCIRVKMIEMSEIKRFTSRAPSLLLHFNLTPSLAGGSYESAAAANP